MGYECGGGMRVGVEARVPRDDWAGTARSKDGSEMGSR